MVWFLKFNGLIERAAVFSFTIDCPVAAQQGHVCVCVCLCECVVLWGRGYITGFTSDSEDR